MATKRSRTKSSLPRLSRDGERLASMAQSLSASGTRVEDVYWHDRVGAQVRSLLEAHADAGIDGVLDYLDATTPPAYDALIEIVETEAETVVADDRVMLLVAAPILAWSRYAVASGPIKADAAEILKTQLAAHCAAEGVAVAISPYLYSIDQLPRDFSHVHALTNALGQRALGADEKKAPAKRMPETAALLADTRYLLAVFVAKRDAPLFRWQEEHAPQEGRRSPDRREFTREVALERWREQGLPTLKTLLPGCVLDVLIPDGYHVALRDADREIRPYAVRAAIAYLESALDVKAENLRAVVAGFGQDRAEEYRIGFTQSKNPDVVHGVVWPLFGREEGPEVGGPEEQIATLLRDNGITEVVVLEQGFPLEFCDDCGAPLFADPVGDLVHAELPEETEAPRAHLH